MDKRLYFQVETALNRILLKRSSVILSCVKPSIHQRIDSINKNSEKELSLYDYIMSFVRRLKNPCFIKKSGKISEPEFYEYALVDKTTWSNIRNNIGYPSKKSLLKLIFALRLNEEEANLLMKKGSSSLNTLDPRDRVVLALIDLKIYDKESVYDVLEEYGKNGAVKFENIY